MTHARMLSAAMLAAAGLGFAAPSLAAPATPAAETRAADGFILAGGRGDQNFGGGNGALDDLWQQNGKNRKNQRGGSQASRGGDRNWQDNQHGDTRRSDRSRPDQSRGDQYGRGGDDWNWRNQRGHDNGDRYGRGGDDWNWRDQRGHDNGNHYGWYKRDYRYEAPVHWRWERNPRHDYWVGRRFPVTTRYVIIDRYDDYYLPPPPRGYYYARVDSDVFLVAEATKKIIDAFVLFDAVGR